MRSPAGVAGELQKLPTEDGARRDKHLTGPPRGLLYFSLAQPLTVVNYWVCE